MKGKINSIDMNEKLKHDEIYNLFKTHSSKANKEISKKIDTFKYNMNFFKHYADEDIKNLLNIFELKISEKSDELFSLFESDIERYISCISQIILAIKLFLKTQDILTKVFINAKNHLFKLKYENKLKNYNQHNLFLYLESLLKISKKKKKFYSSATTLNQVSSKEKSIKHSSFTKFSSELKISGFSNDEIKSTIYNKLITPRFESKPNEKFENQELKNTNSENLVENNYPIKDDSVFTLSDIVFDEEPLTPKNLEVKLIEPRIITKKNTYTKIRIQQIDKDNKLKNVRQLLNKTNFINKNNKKNYCRNLLEMINSIYKKGLINSEEKIKLKQLVIEKSKKIIYLYDNIYLNTKNDKNKLVSEVKKILNSFVEY